MDKFSDFKLCMASYMKRKGTGVASEDLKLQLPRLLYFMIDLMSQSSGFEAP